MRHLRQTDKGALDDPSAGQTVRLTLRPIHGSRVKLDELNHFKVVRPLSGLLCIETEGGRHLIDAGDLCFVRPEDQHRLSAPEGPVTVELAAFSPSLIGAIGQRHPDLQGHLFWSELPEPEVVSARRAEIAGIGILMKRFFDSACDTLSAEAFLLPLCDGLVDRSMPRLPDFGPGAPDWLRIACLVAQDKAVFREGAAGFARAAGRTHPHVCRVARKYLGMSPSAYINRQRMIFAARRLSRTNESIRCIAMECGLPNLSHFHRVFLEYHKVTPLQFRKRFRKSLL